MCRNARRKEGETGAVIVEAARRSEFGDLEALARRARVEIVRSISHARGGHLGGPLSAADLLIALYFRILRIRPDEPDWADRDRFVLSKGHSSIALYAAMALRGYFPLEELLTFDYARLAPAGASRHEPPSGA